MTGKILMSKFGSKMYKISYPWMITSKQSYTYFANKFVPHACHLRTPPTDTVLYDILKYLQIKKLKLFWIYIWFHSAMLVWNYLYLYLAKSPSRHNLFCKFRVSDFECQNLKFPKWLGHPYLILFFKFWGTSVGDILCCVLLYLKILVFLRDSKVIWNQYYH